MNLKERLLLILLAASFLAVLVVAIYLYGSKNEDDLSSTNIDLNTNVVSYSLDDLDPEIVSYSQTQPDPIEPDEKAINSSVECINDDLGLNLQFDFLESCENTITSKGIDGDTYGSTKVYWGDIDVVIADSSVVPIFSGLCMREFSCSRDALVESEKYELYYLNRHEENTRSLLGAIKNSYVVLSVEYPDIAEKDLEESDLDKLTIIVNALYDDKVGINFPE